MADISTAVDNSSAEVRGSEAQGYKRRNSIRRASVLVGGNFANSGMNASGNILGGRLRRESSTNSVPRTLYDRRFVRYENTYRMEPDDQHRVDLARVRRIATSVIDTAIVSYKYDANQAQQFAVVLADLIRNQLKQLPFSRYKIVTQVSIGEKKGQDLRIASRCIWDAKQDRHITITKEAADAYVTVTIFFLYID